jgi:hypothetical protein
MLMWTADFATIDQLKETIDLDQVKSVQLTENSCIVSVEDSETKDKLILMD